MGAPDIAAKLLGRLERTLFTPRCVLCRRRGEAIDLCARCRRALPVNHPTCESCALPLSSRGLCGSCLRDMPGWHAARAPYLYADSIRELVHKLKFGGVLAAGRVLGELTARALAREGVLRPDLIVPVPLHPARERQRGFNQAREIARPIARWLGVPQTARACTRVRATAAQSQLPQRARRANLRGAFVADPGLVRGSRLAIVDDVMTTGTTAAELVGALQAAGARRVEVWCCARALPPGMTRAS